MSQHQRNVLDKIADSIVQSLERRPIDGPWPIEQGQKDLARIISDTISVEKGLSHSPALHPDDPFPLLFWGPFDDISPLTVRAESHKKLKLEIPEKLIVDAWNERWTIERFITQCTVESRSIR